MLRFGRTEMNQKAAKRELHCAIGYITILAEGCFRCCTSQSSYVAWRLRSSMPPDKLLKKINAFEMLVLRLCGSTENSVLGKHSFDKRNDTRFTLKNRVYPHDAFRFGNWEISLTLQSSCLPVAAVQQAAPVISCKAIESRGQKLNFNVA